MKQVTVATFCLLIYIVGFEWIFHGVLLGSHYQATAELWRSEADMQARLGWMFAGQFLIAVLLAQLFGYLKSGFVKMGALLGALYGSGQLIMHSVAPYPIDLTLFWIAGGLIEYAGAGLVYGLVSGQKS